MQKTLKILAFSLLVLNLYSCLGTLPVRPRNNNSVIYIHRADAALLGRSDYAAFYLNGIEITRLTEPDTYKAVHTTPGFYRIQYKMFTQKDELIKVFTWESSVEPNQEYLSGVGYTFGWQCLSKFVSPWRTKITSARNAGEADATKLVKPQKQ